MVLLVVFISFRFFNQIYGTQIQCLSHMWSKRFYSMKPNSARAWKLTFASKYLEVEMMRRLKSGSKFLKMFQSHLSENQKLLSKAFTLHKQRIN